MFIVTWLFDKLGYMPKINVEAGAIAAWPFPEVSDDFDPRAKDKDFFGLPRETKTKPVVKKKPAAKKVIVPKATTRKPKVVAKTARTKVK